MPDIPWLVLPTFNEAENVEAIVRAADAVLRDASPEGHRILVVDDSSPDGTGALAEALGVELGTVEVLHRTERQGLGPAYIAGFEHAIAGGATHVMEMDADFSHDPADLARLLAATSGPDRAADLALGSRYVDGGGVTDWGPVRRVVSSGGSWYARRILGLAVRDLTGGFKCFRSEVLAAIDLHEVRSVGYAFQVELTYRAVQAGFRVREVPIIFRDREHGSSKMSWHIALEAVWLVPQLRFSRGRRARRRPRPERQGPGPSSPGPAGRAPGGGWPGSSPPSPPPAEAPPSSLSSEASQTPDERSRHGARGHGPSSPGGRGARRP